MRLTVKEQERILIFNVAEMSRRRWKRGIRLNYIEAQAIIMDELLERARAGMNNVTELMDIGSRILSEEDVMEGTAALMPEIMFEVTLPDGTKLVTVHDPIRLEKMTETIPKEKLISLNY